MWGAAGIVFAGCISIIYSLEVRHNHFPYEGSHRLDRDEEVPNEPLIITPYLEREEFEEARKLAKNPPFIADVESYSGFFTVDKSKGMNTFFWYFPAELSSADQPLMVWLQGGPGASSMFGALIENGPYMLKPNGELIKRNYNWNKNINMLYLDNPAGTGFSFTNDGTVPTTQSEVGNYLYRAVQQFLQLFPELRERPFYVSGESYGGKYVPALAHTIHRMNPTHPKIKLVGLAIGNGLIDPVNIMSVYPEHQYQLGLVDDAERRDLEERCENIVKDIRAGNWYDASERFRELFWNSKTQPPNLLKNNTGFTYHYNILISDDDGSTKAVRKYMSLPEVKEALHVGNLSFQDGSLSEEALHDDMMKSVLPWFIELCENYNVLLFSGQLDIILPHSTTASFLKKMKWSGAAAFKAAKKNIWRVGKEVAGYSKTIRRRKSGRFIEFSDVLVRNAGHIVPQDRPKVAYDMISRFTTGEPF